MNKLALTTKIISNDLFFEQVKALLVEGKTVKIPVVGNSMNPFLRHGDEAVLKRPNLTDLIQGNIVLAYFNQAYVLHRIIRKEENKLFLAGDGNFWQVEVVDVSDVLGVIIQTYRRTRVVKNNNLTRIWFGKIWYNMRPVRFLFKFFLKRY